ncbi:DUF4132 domain-containing protein [Actinoplanes sp. RD1]|uniref:DUF4132 domain-containing protein n=1 Tax=Actinoplanes sp. RD1 TaxID=3064538 RepID=UPI0027403264|nr:DUF4132 domain-containing protein [Actinoplanes sp. RD1]
MTAQVSEEEWLGERQRLAALQWHMSAVARGWPDFEPEPEIYEITREPVPWHADDLGWSLRALGDDFVSYDGQAYHLPAIIAQQVPVEVVRAHEAALAATMEQICGEWEMPGEIRRRLTAQYGRALGRLTVELPPHLLSKLDAFGPAARAALGPLVADPALRAVLEFAETLAKPVPPRSWLRRGEALLTAGPGLTEAVRSILGAFADVAVAVHDEHDWLLRGLCWMAAASDPSEETTVVIARVAGVAGEPVRQGARVKAALTATAAVEILVGREGAAPVRGLARLALVTRSKPLRARVRTALDRLGAARDWAPGEALELAVDDHGLDADGSRSWPAPEGCTIVVEIVGEKAVVRARRDGRRWKSLPAAVKEHADEARAVARELTKTLAAERARVEDLLAQDRTWPWEVWRERYLRHPVTGSIARRLIWEFSADGQTWTAALPDAAEGPGTVVRLWHPVQADVAEVAAWRDRIAAAGLRQPFKQAFREVYKLTPAEERTRVYSNRFAGHILRYRQASALLRVRGWSASYLGHWDSGYESEATRELAAATWQASFFHALVHEDEGARTGPVEYCTTDQVRFARRDGRLWEQVPVTEVPPRVLSEAMRDVDLFVGVTSIAADDSWADRGEHRFGAYWAGAAFGALTGGAEVRRDMLARLLPRLAIGARCELTDRFLRVRGTRAVYKIHLGSGNILMEPHDAYLCIVPGGRGARVTLPFDDDERLSLILSKAFLLAADDTITDATILRQLPR